MFAKGLCGEEVGRRAPGPWRYVADACLVILRVGRNLAPTYVVDAASG